ncbi:MAG: patatin-like phospholipase family protein [Actinomycetota bacterium]
MLPITVPAGETLIEEGDAAGDAFIVVAGRLVASTLGEDGSRVVVGEVVEGDLVGEMSLLTQTERTATVTAVRDCTLLRISADDFSRVVVAEPLALFDVARTVVTRLDHLIHDRRPGIAVGVVALIPCGDGPYERSFIGDLREALDSNVQTTVVDRERLVADLGPSPTGDAITSFLHEVELKNDLTFLIADSGDSEWNQLCVRQADLNLLVGRHDGMKGVGPSELALAALSDNIGGQATHLVMLHDGEMSSDTAEILELRCVSRHHHVRVGRSADFERLARVLTRTSVGLVLGGGGARGFAHIGVIRALAEVGIPIDHVGGTSIGSAIAAGYAMGYEWEKVLDLMRRVTVDRGSLIDFSFPAVALARGERLTGGLREALGSVRIEDLWTDFFCVSTDLTNSDEYVHEAGSVWRAMRASIAIPGILPPVRSPEGHVLVDGGVLNNLPTDVMRERFDPETVIAVDLRADVDIPASDLGDDGVASGWRVLGRRLAPWKEPMQVPRMLDILARSTAVTGSDNALLADLLFRPPVAEFGILDFASYERIVTAGYEQAIDVLETSDDLPGILGGHL